MWLLLLLFFNYIFILCLLLLNKHAYIRLHQIKIKKIF